MSSIQQNLLSTVIHYDTAKELWETLTSMFISQTQARLMPLKMQIQTQKKRSMSMSEYFAKMKRIANNLALAGKPVELNDFIMHILTGLDSSDYESLVTTVLARGENINLDEFYFLLLSHENRIEQNKGKVSSNVFHYLFANVAKKNQNFGKNCGGYQKNNGGFFGTRNNFGGFDNGGPGNNFRGLNN